MVPVGDFLEFMVKFLLDDDKEKWGVSVSL